MIRENVMRALFCIMLLGGGVFWFIQPQDNVYASKQPDSLEQLDFFMDAYKKIQTNYVDEVSDEDLMFNAVKGMLQELDPHSTLMSAREYKDFMESMKGEFGGLGMQVGMRDNLIKVVAPIDNTPAAKAGIKAGDIIYKIDDTLTVGMTVDDAVKLMRGKPKTKIQLTMIREGESKPLVFNLVRDIIKVDSVQYEMIDNTIGYIRLSEFKIGAGNEVSKALQALIKQKAKGIILDLRNNPGGSLDEAEAVLSLFLPKGEVVVTTKDRHREDSVLTRAFSFRDTKIPLVVLINEGSASASEIVAGAVQDHKRGVVVGITTFGKASVQRLIDLNGGAAMKITISRYYTPIGRSIQGVGIVPDIEVAPGKIVYDERPSYIVKERDLAKHLIGENEANENNGFEARKENDLQLQSAIQIIKGLTLNEQ